CDVYTTRANVMIQTPAPRIYVERTLGLIKPDAIHHTEKISLSALGSLLQVGVQILEQCSDYVEQYGKLFFPSLQELWIYRLLEDLSNYTKARETPRMVTKCGTSDLRNAMHGSVSFSAEREVKAHSIPMGEAAKDYLGRFVSPTLLRRFTELCKQKPVSPFTWLADWLVRNNPNKPKIFDGATGEEAA
uniref:Nucleoside diphosphate kinase homolog 5 n=1 Tax=Salmo trutta TaxID=8032 RepID=A0A673YJQ1_SALTR